jgi:heme-degrading monooxygenase HmoA
MWHGIASRQNLQCILEVLSSSRLRGSLDAKGNLGGLLLSRESNGAAEVYLLTLWESEEAIRGFAGDNLYAPAYQPGDEKYVVSQEPHVKYFEAVIARLDEGSQRHADLIGAQTS